MATGWNVMDALNNKTKAAAVDNKPKARFRTKDINIDQLYSNDKNFYSIPDIEQLASDIFAVGLLENLTVVHDPCDRGEYRIIAGERRWRALTLLVEQGHEEFAVASCQIKTPAEENEEMIQLIIANTYRNKTTADILEEQKKLEETLKHMKEQGLTLNGYKLDSGRLRDVIADMMQVSSTKIAQIESINKKLIPEFTEELKNGGLTFSAAYEISKMSEDIQEDMLEHHREKGLTYKDVKEYAEEQKKAEEEQIDGQLSIEDVNDSACQNLTPEENSDQSENAVSELENQMPEVEKAEERLEEWKDEEQEENQEAEEVKTPNTYAVSDLEEKEEQEITDDIRDNRQDNISSEAVVERIEESEPWGRKTEEMDLRVAEEERKKASMYFEMALKTYGDYDERTRKQKVLIVALDLLIHNLRVTDNGYKREVDQPELPKFKNNDQRKDWLRNYRDWGLWYTDRNININYYKYDFADGSRLVVAEYLDRINAWNGREKEDEYYFHLLKKNKKSYAIGKPYDKQYMNSTDSETYLVEFLKNLQKNA